MYCVCFSFFSIGFSLKGFSVSLIALCPLRCLDYFSLKSMSADAILLSKYKNNRHENAFGEVVSTREVYGEK